MINPQSLPISQLMASAMTKNPGQTNPNFGRPNNFWQGNNFMVPALAGWNREGSQGLFGAQRQMPQMKGLSGVLAQLMKGGNQAV